jgi:hypothetical protein
MGRAVHGLNHRARHAVRGLAGFEISFERVEFGLKCHGSFLSCRLSWSLLWPKPAGSFGVVPAADQSEKTIWLLEGEEVDVPRSFRVFQAGMTRRTRAR